MNRHERRAAAKSTSKAKSDGGPGTLAVEQPSSSGTAGDDKHSLNNDFFSVPLPPIVLQQESQESSSVTGKNNPSFLLRLFSKVLLSNFILKRVKEPQIEALLFSIASTVGRQDVMDELKRRENSRYYIDL